MMAKKMHILVTGSAGFVGSDIIPKLQSLGHIVTGIDIVEENQSDKAYLHDLTKPINLDNIKYDLCIHLASAVGGILFNIKQENIIIVNEAINNTVIDICRQATCNKMVFFSSINVYETGQPYEHDALQEINQRSFYALSKAKSERQIEKKIENIMIIRPTNIFGKNQIRRHNQYGESHVIPDLLKKIETEACLEVFGDGTQIRNFVHVGDVNEFIIKNLYFTGKQYFNIRSNITINIAELTRELLKYTQANKKIKYRREYMKYEIFKISEFDMTLPVKLGWAQKINSITQGLAV